MSAIVLISSSVDISMAKPCELKKALDLLGLEETPPCAYSPIKDMSYYLIGSGVVLLVVNFFLFLMISYFEELNRGLLIAVSNTYIFYTSILNFLIICINT